MNVSFMKVFYPARLSVALLLVAASCLAGNSDAESPQSDVEIDGVQLSEGFYVPQQFPMTAVSIRPDAETGSYASDNVNARYRWAYYDGTNAVRYEWPVKIFGGSAPHRYTLLQAPPGMTVGNQWNPSDHGIIKWIPEQPQPESNPAKVVLRVTGQDGHHIDITWTIATTQSQDKFIFVDSGVLGDDETGTGAIDAPFKTLRKVMGETRVQETFPGRLVYLRGGSYATAAHTDAWNGGNASETVPARIELRAENHPICYMSYPDEIVSIDWSGGQIQFRDNDFCFMGSSTEDIRVLGSAVNAAETHNFWGGVCRRVHWAWVNFDGYVPRTAGNYTNARPIFSPAGGNQEDRQYWSLHACKETNRTASASNDGLLFCFFGISYVVDEYSDAERPSGAGAAYKDTCFNTSTRYGRYVVVLNTTHAFAFMGQSTSGNQEICYSVIGGPLFFNLQANGGTGELVEYRNLISTADRNYQHGLRAWKGEGPFRSINSVIMSNGPDVVNPLVEVVGGDSHSTNGGGDRSINDRTLTLQNGDTTPYRDLYLGLRGPEIVTPEEE